MLKNDFLFFELTAFPTRFYYITIAVSLWVYIYTMYLRMQLCKDFLHSFLTKVRVGHPLANKLLWEVVPNKKKDDK